MGNSAHMTAYVLKFPRLTQTEVRPLLLCVTQVNNTVSLFDSVQILTEYYCSESMAIVTKCNVKALFTTERTFF